MKDEMYFGKTKIFQVQTPRHLQEFINLPRRIYQNDPQWAPQLDKDLNHFLSARDNPFFRHARSIYFLAEKDGMIQGRISAIENRVHNEFHEDKVGFFGNFECVNDPQIAQALLEVSAGWLEEKGLSSIRGPMNFSMNEDFGCLVENNRSKEFPQRPFQPHTPPFYETLFKSGRLEPIKDCISLGWEITHGNFSTNMHRALKSLNNINIRPIRYQRMDHFLEDLRAINSVYLEAWKKNWGFLPTIDEEIIFNAKMLRRIIDPNLMLMAEVDGKAIGMLLGIPDYYPMLRVFKEGKAYPWHWPQAYWAKKRERTAVIIAFGIRPSWQQTGLADLLLSESVERNPKYDFFETNWILEENKRVQHLIKTRLNAKTIKRFRVYEKKII